MKITQLNIDKKRKMTQNKGLKQLQNEKKSRRKVLQLTYYSARDGEIWHQSIGKETKLQTFFFFL